jgi:hypothetical protein
MKDFEPNRRLKQRIREIYDENPKYHELDIDAIIREIESSDSLFDLDELNEAVWDSGVLQEEFIYYHDAIKYLMENDPSLSEAFEIASEHCFDTKNLNSCVLAGLLASRLNEEDWHNLARELDEEDFDDDGERRDQMLEQILDE